jgi:hypothetical protein
MSTIWYCTNKKGEKIRLTGGELKGLCKTGRITPETIIETEDGRKVPAGKVKGLTFAVPEVAPPPEPSPFAAPLPVVAEPADNPFTVAAPVASRVAPQGRITPTTPLETDTGYKGRAGQLSFLKFNTAAPPPVAQTPRAESSKPPISIPVIVGLGILLFVLVIGGLGVSSCNKENERLLKQHSDFMRDREERNEQQRKEAGEAMQRRINDMYDNNRRQQEERRRQRGY